MTHNDEPNKGLGDHLGFLYVGLILGFVKFGFDWYGLKAWLFSLAFLGGYAAIKAIVFTLLDKFKG